MQNVCNSSDSMSTEFFFDFLFHRNIEQSLKSSQLKIFLSQFSDETELIIFSIVKRCNQLEICVS